MKVTATVTFISQSISTVEVELEESEKAKLELLSL
jgi:hypothetical protein